MIFPERDRAVEGQLKPWPLRMLGMADYVAQEFSKDPSTKCGAVVVNAERNTIGTGYNGFPPQIEDRPEWYADREMRLDTVIHAEVNALNNSTADVRGAALFVTSPCCHDCAKFVVSKRIGEVHFRKPSTPEQISFAIRWADKLKASMRTFRLAGVPVTVWDEDGPVEWMPEDMLADAAQPDLFAPPARPTAPQRRSARRTPPRDASLAGHRLIADDADGDDGAVLCR